MKYIDKELQKEIQENFFKNYKLHGNKFVLTQKSTNIFFNNFKKYYEICLDILSKQNKFESIRNVLYCILTDFNLTICHNKKCNKEIIFTKSFKGNLYCSQKCTNSDKELCNQKTKIMFQTNNNKYGYKTVLLDPKNRHKAINKSNTPEARLKIFKSRRKTTIKSWNKKLEDTQKQFNITLLNDKIIFGETYISDSLYQFTWKCNKCGLIFKNRFTYRQGIYCSKCNHLSGSSHEEQQMVNFISNIVGKENIITRKMILKANLITRFQIDVYIPKLKLGFEYDGLYYHQYDQKKDNFHLYKTILAEENNIRLVHIRSDMWLKNNNETKKLITNIILGNIDFSPYNNKDLLIIDRSIFNKAWNFNGYTLINVIKPTILNLNLNGRQYKYQDCGKLIYQKNMNKYIY